ncbi:MAG TPA: MFS transporter [Sphingomonas sp.]|nr:MFS transporter [Sphingomonas sp.]
MTTRLSLLASRRFWPLFATQFLGAFNDNLFRSAMLFLIAFRVLKGDPEANALAATAAGGVFILPFFLFSSLSGQFADRIDKARIARWVKLAEVAIMAVGLIGLAVASLPLLYLVLFAMGTHSTLFGPIKYAILPQHLKADELATGTGMVEAATFLAILLGQIGGGLMPAEAAGAVLMGVALAGVLASRFIPPAPPEGAPPPVDWNIARGTVAILRHAGSSPAMLRTIIGISWFFSLGAVLTQQFVPLVAGLNARPEVAAFFLALFSVGVAIGSLLAGRLMRGRVTGRPVLPAALAIALLTLGLALCATMPAANGPPTGLVAFLARPRAWALCLDLVALAIAGGVYIVPLYALLQTLGEPAARARDVAANNVANALAMVAISLLSAVPIAFGWGLPGLFAALGLLGFAAVRAARGLP